MSTAFDLFNRTVSRSRKLLTIYKSGEGASCPGISEITSRDVCDILRSSVVFAVSAMDAYFTDKFADMVVPFLQKKGSTEKLVEVLSEAGLDTRVALELISMDR